MIDKLKATLLSIQLFSRLVIQTPLRPYQVEPANAVIESCLHQRGLEFLWVFPRQSGKDETIAQLVVFLLTLFQRMDACIVHVYPTAQQLTTGTTRLQHRLENLWTAGRSWARARPTRLGLGQAVCAFFSGHPQARAEGATANLLLIVNEAQDQVEPIIERRFTPMRASTNATALYVGTVRTTSDYLWKVKTRLERLQATDGQRRVFVVTPDQVGQANPHYQEFVQSQIALKGRQHPTVKTELFNEPLDTAAGLFPPRRIELMRGTHEYQADPQPGAIYIAALDVGGQDEQATAGAFADLANPGRDYTVCTIAQVTPTERGTHFDVVNTFADQGTRHFQPAPGKPPLFDSILAYLNHWQPIAVICDSTGVGQGIADALIKAYPRQVVPFMFTSSSKAALGNNFLALVETGRFTHFTQSTHPAVQDAADSFFRQCERCSYELAEGVPIEKGLRWGVPANATYTDDLGNTHPVHDDRLLSAALFAQADQLIKLGAIFVGTSESAVIQRPERGRPARTRKDTWQ
jgi:hypothetical protein